MDDRESIEKMLSELRARQEEAESVAESAREGLSRLSIRPLSDLNADEIENAADDLAAAVRKTQLLADVRRQLRALLT